MKTLAATFRSHGYDFNQIERIGDVALYEKTTKDVPRPSYEVVLVQRHEERVIAGNTIAAGESMPGAEQWGMKGWSLTTPERAREKFAEMVAKHPAKDEAPTSDGCLTLAELAEREGL